MDKFNLPFEDYFVEEKIENQEEKKKEENTENKESLENIEKKEIVEQHVGNIEPQESINEVEDIDEINEAEDLTEESQIEKQSNINKNCFPKDRPEFDLDIYDYLIQKGYPFIPRKQWPTDGSKDCYLFLGNENYIVITPYEGNSTYQFIPYISLIIHKTEGCSLDLIYDKKERDGTISNRVKCLICIINAIVQALQNAGYTLNIIIDNHNIRRYRLKLNVSDWQSAIDYFYDVLVPIIDNVLSSSLKSVCQNCQNVISKITDKEFEEHKQRIKNHIKKKNCRNRNKPDTINPQNEDTQKTSSQTGQRQNPLNLILYGPPGTSKTYNIISYAVAMVENVPINEILSQPRDKVLERYEEYLDSGQIVFTTFHPSYSYEDFIEGLKAKVENGQVQYYVEDGIFKKIAKRAKENKDKSYVIIIDEINRGNIPSIFGELITLIEEDKREGEVNAISVKLPYSKENFSVPNNLYILGTMNTADRSIALLDIALRRRFEFEELIARPDLLNGIKVIDNNNNPLNIDLEKLLECLNKKIEERLDRNKTIGHAYFLSLVKQNQLTLTDLNKIFKNKIIPLLQEYFYDDWDKIREVLNDVNTGYFIQKNKSRISDDLNNLSLQANAFTNIYKDCQNLADKQNETTNEQLNNG